MKAKLIKKDNDYFLEVEFWYPKYIQPSIIANTFVKPKGEVYDLCRKNCDEIFGVVDVEKLAKEESYKAFSQTVWINGFKAGFNKAMELNKDKVFTLEDVITAIVHHTYLLHNDGKGYEDGDNNDDRIDYVIAALKQQPTEIEVEIVCMTAMNMEHSTNTGIPKLDSDGQLILKKI